MPITKSLIERLERLGTQPRRADTEDLITDLDELMEAIEELTDDYDELKSAVEDWSDEEAERETKAEARDIITDLGPRVAEHLSEILEKIR